MPPIQTNVVVPTLCVHQPLDSTAKLNYTYRNKIVNGGFDIWQRGAAFDLAVAGYTADRWLTDLVGQITRETFVAGESQLMDNAKYYLKTTPAGSTPASIEQRIEGVRTLAGKQITLTFWAKCGIPGSTLSIAAIQNFGTTGGVSVGAEVSTVVGTSVLLNVWLKKTLTVTLTTIAGKTIGTDGNDYLAIRFGLPIDNLYLCNVQLEQGPLATDFEQRPIDEELRLCRRFYEQQDILSGQVALYGIGTSGTDATFSIPYATKRAIPEITVPGTLQIAANSDTPTWSDGVISEQVGNKIATVSSGLVAGVTVLGQASSDCSITIDAEL
jgi:hypothetical protein